MDTKNLYLIGAGGLGAELYSQIIGDVAHGREWQVVGFLDDSYPGVASCCGVPVLSSINNHVVDPSKNVYLSAIGNVFARKKITEYLLKSNAVFIPVATRVSRGVGTVYGRSYYGLDVKMGSNVKTGDYCHIDADCNLGHDVVIGDYCHLGPRVLIAGGCSVGDLVVMHGGCIIAKGVRIGVGAEIGLGAVVLRDVPDNAIVLGNPARIIGSRKI